MKNTGIVMAAVAGLASVAGAQTGSLMLVPSTASIDTTMTTQFTLAVYADADFGSHIAGGAFSLAAVGTTDDVVGMNWVSAPWAGVGENDRGYAGDGNYTGVVFGQVIVPDFAILPNPASALGNGSALIGWFEIDLATFNGFTYIEWTTASDPVSDFVLEVYNETDQSFTRLLNDDFSGHGSASIAIIPAPSSLALIGLGGLVAGRRRR